MKWINLLLLVLLVCLQTRIWFGEGSLAQAKGFEQELANQQAENRRLDQRNQQLTIDVQALKNGLDSVEARARRELGMIREGETFFLVLNK